jgi:hypothetical protein
LLAFGIGDTGKGKSIPVQTIKANKVNSKGTKMSSIFDTTEEHKNHPGRYGYGRVACHRLEPFPEEWEGKTPMRVRLTKNLMLGPDHSLKNDYDHDGWSPEPRTIECDTEMDVLCNCFGALCGYPKNKKPPIVLPSNSYIVIKYWEDIN